LELLKEPKSDPSLRIGAALALGRCVPKHPELLPILENVVQDTTTMVDGEQLSKLCSHVIESIKKVE
jgi:hypothetical protein